MSRKPSLHFPIILAALIAGSAYFMGHPAPRSSSQPAGRSAAIPAASGTSLPGGGIPTLASGTAAGSRSGAPAAGAASAPPLVVASSPATAGATTLPRPVAPAATQKRRPSAVQYAIRATWFCGHGSRCTRGYPAGGMYAAISPDLATWTGRLVRVSYHGRSVTVRIIDCLCSREHGIDLYSTAYARLAPLSTGVITVTLELL